ncbi:MAG: aldo/keto reductase [Woeseiaceae bacterium]|jgi:diketogulonate reductase-like aldo/keto reductase|nr:aldo/keto reductase [Woeseiaceae bacterium]
MQRIDRREFLGLSAGLGIVGALGPLELLAAADGLVRRPIPVSGEMLPIIGLGTNRYGVGPDEASRAPLRASLARFGELGGSVVDTAPMYRSSESVLGDLIAELGIRDTLFIATKVDQTERAASVAQMNASLEKLGVDRFDLMQVHNLLGWRENIPLIREWKEAGKTRYTGITTSRSSQYEELESILREHELDFLQINYSLEQREAALRLLPLAAERGMAVIINRAFGGGRIFRELGDQPLPVWAAEFDCTSWAQFLLKYALSHPAATVAIPGMTKVHHVEDNLLAGHGRMPSPEHRKAMEALYDAL